ncbi:hypothetical protein BIV57_16450 [Mangrovactinospora gilvigrisea]|uniref:ABC transporter substrate-binding protein n=1 Tax=Mangrovactinospora gilvigrisea TaxID=1428644 RepID=A0A1J7BSI1_9ACTN|nr:hypothetical protein BIV57_16450 [Mangrovactinospora gilvigrisea]
MSPSSPSSRSSRTAPSRRGVLAGLGLAAGGAVLSGCASPAVAGIVGTGPGKDTLQFWSLLGGADGIVMQGMVDQYKKTHPNVKQQTVTLGWGDPYYTKLSLAVIGNHPPDVGIAHLTRARILAKAGLLDPIAESDLERNGLRITDFNPVAVQMATINGKLYAVPLDTHVQTVFYNTKICKQAGLLKPDGTLVDLDSRDRFTEAALESKKVTKQWGFGIGVQDPVISWRQFQGFYSQAGGQVVADQGTKVVLDDDKAGEVIDFITGLTLHKGAVPSTASSGAVFNAFAAGTLGLFIDGDWDISAFKAAKTPFDMTRFPQLFGSVPTDYKVQADSHSLVLPRNSGRSRQRLDTTLQFIKSIISQSLTWGGGGHIPAYLPTDRSEAYKKLKPNSNYAASARHAAYDPDAWYSGSGSHFESVVGGYLSAAFTGQSSVSAALKNMRRDLNRLAKTKSPLKSA